MSDIKKDKELYNIPPGMRVPSEKTLGQKKPKKNDIRSKVALIFFVTLLILIFFTLTSSLYYTWQFLTANDNDLTIMKHGDNTITDRDPDEWDFSRDLYNDDDYYNGTRNINVLIGDLKKSNKTVRRKAMVALAEIGNPKGIPPIATILRRSKDPKERRAAAEALGEFKHHLAVEPLIDALKDHDEDVRNTALYYLSESYDMRVFNMFVEMLSSKDDDLRLSAACKLERFKHPLAVEALTNSLNDENYYVRRCTISALGEIGGSKAIEAIVNTIDETMNKETIQYLTSALEKVEDPNVFKSLLQEPSDINPYAKMHVVIALGKLDDASVVEELIEILNGSDYALKYAAAEALGIIGSPEAADALLATLEETKEELLTNPNNSSEEKFLKIVRALGKTGNLKAEKVLLDLISKRNTIETQKCLIYAISQIGSPDSIPVLIYKANGVNNEIARQADFALNRVTGYNSMYEADWNKWWNSNKKDIIKYNSEDMVASFIVALDDPNPTVKIFAINFLSRIKDKRAVEPLIKHFNSDNCDKHTRKEIVKALAKLEDPRSTETLIAALDIDKCYSKDEAALALGNSGDPNAVEPLIRALETCVFIGIPKGPDPESVIVALGKLGDHRATDAIVKRLKIRNPRTRMVAANALEEIGDISAIPHLRKALDDDDKYVREAAARAIFVIEGKHFDIEQYEKDQKEKNKITIRNFLKR